MKTTPPAAPKNETGIVNSFKIGVQAAFGNTSIRYALFLLAFLNFFGAPYSSLLPAFADRLAPGDTQMLGFITAFSGTGSLLGALMLARLRRSPIGTLIGIHAILFSLGLMLLVFPKTLILVTGGAFLAGLGLLVSIASSNTVIQTLVANDKRARVMGIYNFAVLGTLPFGSLLMGWVTQSIGLQKAMFIHGSICILGSVLFFICAPSIDQATRPEPQPEPQPASPEVKAS